eukprot:m.169329 g.169329  ORF g.169329 m.169329 type:complete len:159 (-) comp14492_c2_seq1:63-539(-)
MPYSVQDMLVIDTHAQNATRISVTLSTAQMKWAGAVLAKNGKIYGMPRKADSVLIIDPETNTVDTTTMGGLEAGGANKWGNGALGPDGRIYAPPFDTSDAVLIIDPQTNTTDMTTLSGISVGGYNWDVLVYSPDVNAFYGIPRADRSVLIVSCTKTLS